MAKQRIKQIQYLEIADLLRQHRDTVSKMASYTEVHKWLQKLLGYVVPESSVPDIVKHLGIELKSKPRGGDLKAKHNVSVLSTAILQLYRKLGEEPPVGLVALVEWCGNSTGEGSIEVPPKDAPTQTSSIPVRGNVTDTCKMSVVNGK